MSKFTAGVLACVVLWLPVLGCGEVTEPRPAPQQPDRVAGVLDCIVLSADGESVPLHRYAGDVLLVVNTASRCGLTSQYAGLEALQQRYGGHGFTVLGFPANDFLGQEPGTDAEIQEFCATNYQVTFPVFAKLTVAQGPQQHPLYALLTCDQSPFPGAIRWNFEKFLVNRQGQVVARFAPRTRPEAPEVIAAIEAALGMPPANH